MLMLKDTLTNKHDTKSPQQRGDHPKPKSPLLKGHDTYPVGAFLETPSVGQLPKLPYKGYNINPCLQSGDKHKSKLP